MEKRGQFEISFGVIFSIIIIIAIIGVSAYVLVGLLDTGKCASIGLFYDEIKDETDRAWKSSSYSNVLDFKIEDEIEFVCFGNLDQEYDSSFEEQYKSFFRYKSQDNNLFLYPLEKACDGSLASTKIEHYETREFFCVANENEIVSIKLSKGSFDALPLVEKNG